MKALSLPGLAATARVWGKLRALRRGAALAAVALAIGLIQATSPAQAEGDRPGDFDYLALVLSWSPTYCALETEAADTPQCAGDRPYAFVLHGLWPQRNRGWPEYCRTAERPWVPREVISDMLAIMPSRPLIIHQYRKHGVCTGLNARKYFDISRALFERVTIPRRFRSPQATVFTTIAQVERAFQKANPGLEPEMMSVACGRRGRLREVRICIARDGTYRACTRNESQRRLCRARQLIMPPVRGRPN